jgi:hypothetical protein
MILTKKNLRTIFTQQRSFLRYNYKFDYILMEIDCIISHQQRYNNSIILLIFCFNHFGHILGALQWMMLQKLSYKVIISMFLRSLCNSLIEFLNSIQIISLSSTLYNLDTIFLGLLPLYLVAIHWNCFVNKSFKSSSTAPFHNNLMHTFRTDRVVFWRTPLHWLNNLLIPAQNRRVLNDRAHTSLATFARPCIKAIPCCATALLFWEGYALY